MLSAKNPIAPVPDERGFHLLLEQRRDVGLGQRRIAMAVDECCGEFFRKGFRNRLRKLLQM